MDDGKGLNNWDVFSHKKNGLIDDGSNGDVSVDEYHRYQVGIIIISCYSHYAYAHCQINLNIGKKKTMGIRNMLILWLLMESRATSFPFPGQESSQVSIYIFVNAFCLYVVRERKAAKQLPSFDRKRNICRREIRCCKFGRDSLLQQTH